MGSSWQNPRGLQEWKGSRGGEQTRDAETANKQEKKTVATGKSSLRNKHKTEPHNTLLVRQSTESFRQAEGKQELVMDFKHSVPK